MTDKGLFWDWVFQISPEEYCAMLVTISVARARLGPERFSKSSMGKKQLE
jgi:hypothetical protein